MKKVCIIIFIVFATSSFAQVKLKHGLLLGGGGGGLVSGVTCPEGDNYWGGQRRLRAVITTDKANYMLGYKFRIKPLKRKIFYDVDLIAGGRSIDCYLIGEQILSAVGTTSEYYSRAYGISLQYGYAALALTYNYQIHKGLYVGAGISPEYHFSLFADGAVINDMPIITTNTKIDIPVILKVGYELKGIDFSFSYRIGTTNMVASDIVKHGRINEWRVQLFIPF